MKLEVYNENQMDVVDPVRLKLEQDSDGEIVVMAVDKDGDRVYRGSLLRFKPDGSVIRPRGVDPKLGFKLDDKQQLVIKDDILSGLLPGSFLDYR